MNANIEDLAALFVDLEFERATAKIMGEKVVRIESSGLRHYKRLASGKVYKSLTSFLGEVMPRNRHLENWRAEMAADLGSRKAADEFVFQTAEYGSGLHIAVAHYCQNLGVDWAAFEAWAFDYLMKSGFKNGTLSVAFAELTKDFASMLQFFHDYQVKVIAVEIPVFLSDGVATLIDLVVEMNAKEYTEKTPEEKRKRVKAIVNIKSGKKGFFPEHVFQLEGERRMFNETFSDLVGYQIKEVFNLAPADWKESPTYKLKNQTKEIEQGGVVELFNIKLQEAKIRGILGEPKRTFPIFMGKTAYGETPLNALKIMDYATFTNYKASNNGKQDYSAPGK